jgi:hypothetical protein
MRLFFSAILISCLFAGCFHKESNNTDGKVAPPPVDSSVETSELDSSVGTSEPPTALREMIYPDISSLEDFVENNARLVGWNIENFSEDERIPNSYEIFPSDTFLEGKNGSIPRFVLELYDKDGREGADCFILNAWHEAPRDKGIPEINNYNALTDSYSYLTYRADIGDYNPVLQQVIYAPEGIQKELFSHLLYCFFREAEDFGTFLEENDYEIQNPGIIAKYSTFFTSPQPALPLMTPEDFLSVFNPVFETSVTVWKDEDAILHFEGNEDQFSFFIENSPRTGEISPLVIEFKEIQKEGPFESVAENWNHSMQTHKIIQASNPPGQKDILKLTLPVSLYSSPTELELLLNEAKEELQEVKTLAGNSESSPEKFLHPDLEEIAALFSGTLVSAAIVETETLQEESLTNLLLQPDESLMQENPPTAHLRLSDSPYDEDNDPDSLILTGSYSSAAHGTFPFSEQDAVWASFWNDKKVARISRSIYSSGPWLSMKIPMREGLEEGTFLEYCMLFFDEFNSFSEDLPEEIVPFPYNMKNLLPPMISKIRTHSADAISRYLEESFDGTFRKKNDLEGGYRYSCETHPELRIFSSADEQGRQRWLEIYADFPGKKISYEEMDEWNRGNLENSPMSIMSKHPQSGEEPGLKAYISLNAREASIIAALQEFTRELQTVRKDYLDIP